MKSLKIYVAKNGYILTRPETYDSEFVAKNLDEVKNLLAQNLDPLEMPSTPEKKVGRPSKKKRGRPSKK